MSQARKPFQELGIASHEVYASSFRLRVGAKLTTFRPVRVKVGYHLIAPGKRPRIECGVATDADLLHLAREYFGFVGR